VTEAAGVISRPLSAPTPSVTRLSPRDTSPVQMSDVRNQGSDCVIQRRSWRKSVIWELRLMFTWFSLIPDS
jgi:hypothetical protein